ncbi:MAG: hypothetical protein ACE5GQ_08850 [Nitrospinales bacterium]
MSSIKNIRNPFLLALCGPLYMLVGTTAVINGDLLIIFLFFALNFAMLGAYVTEFPLLSGLYLNELAHKTALSALIAMLVGFLGFLLSYALSGSSGSSDTTTFSANSFFSVWVGLAIPSYLAMVFFVFRLNKRDLEAEDVVRRERKKKSKSSGPPIMDRDSF